MGSEIENIKEISKRNYDEHKDALKWITDQLNRTSNSYTARLFWLAGLSLGAMPVLYQGSLNASTTSKYFLLISVALLAISIGFGIIDYFLTRRFYQQHLTKNSLAEKEWRKSYHITINDQNPEDIKMKQAWEAAGYADGLFEGIKSYSPEWPQIVQTITVFFGFALQILTLFI